MGTCSNIHVHTWLYANTRTWYGSPLARLGTVYSQGEELHWEELVTTFWCDPSGPPSPPEPNVSSGSHSILYLVMEDPPSAGGAFQRTLGVRFHTIKSSQSDGRCYGKRFPQAH